MTEGGEDRMWPKVSVVIPFYQEEEGILTGAVRAALAQEGTGAVEIVIVDDGSPVPAREDLRDVLEEARERIRIIEQPNLGPAAARNRALDSVDEETEYVAFLDSDDVWKPSHLLNALEALEAGHDLFYANQFIVGEGRTVFEKTARPRPGDAAPLDGDGPLHRYKGKVVDEILCGNMRTSTLVYRYRAFPHVRFPTEYHYFGEDHTFLLDLTRLTDRIAFSSEVSSDYGSGVSIYAETEWGSPKALRQNNHELRFRKSLLRREELDPRQRALARARIRHLRRGFASQMLHFIWNRKKIEWPVVRRQIRADPVVVVSFLPDAAAVALRRVRGSRESRQG